MGVDFSATPTPQGRARAEASKAAALARERDLERPEQETVRPRSGEPELLGRRVPDQAVRTDEDGKDREEQAEERVEERGVLDEIAGADGPDDRADRVRAKSAPGPSVGRRIRQTAPVAPARRADRQR